MGKSGRFARSLCAKCPVRDLCLQYAVEHHEIGIWGGTSETERRELRKDAAA